MKLIIQSSIMIIQNYNETKFITSIGNIKELKIQPHGFEIACIGYSNSGKSTLINCLANNSKLSRCSKYPGRTNMINIFQVNQHFRLVDLPGYGYSVYNRNEKLNNLILYYLKNRLCLKGLILLIDIRRLFRKKDIELLQYINKKNINLIILLNKCDKFNACIRKKILEEFKKDLFLSFKCAPVILFSALKKIGVNYLIKVINKWYNNDIQIK